MAALATAEEMTELCQAEGASVHEGEVVQHADLRMDRRPAMRTTADQRPGPGKRRDSHTALLSVMDVEWGQAVAEVQAKGSIQRQDLRKEVRGDLQSG